MIASPARRSGPPGFLLRAAAVLPLRYEMRFAMQDGNTRIFAFSIRDRMKHKRSPSSNLTVHLMEQRQQIVFVDIDGVLLSRAAWGSPANVRLLAEEAVRAMATFESSARASFDPVSVVLVNRACHRTDRLIVLSTSWRKSYGIPETRAKLVAEGIEEALFHPDYACPLGSGREKGR